MAYTQTAEFEIASERYVDIQDTTDGSTTHSKGALAAINNCVCFPLADVAVSSKFAAVLQADKVSALKKTETIAAGQKLYWDNAASKVTAVDSTAGLPNIGYALEDAASADNTVVMYFDGRGLALT
jgi:predicted RecA/RadA family phage recombinase